MGERIGLATLVERACRRLFQEEDFRTARRVLDDHGSPFAGRAFWAWVGNQITSATQRCRAGVHPVAWFHYENLMPGPDLVGFDGMCSLPGLVQVYSSTTVAATFERGMEEAERMDAFLATLERDRASHPLARDCRNDLALLNVLADWCEDNGRPAAAAEARHLWGLVVARLRM